MHINLLRIQSVQRTMQVKIFSFVSKHKIGAWNYLVISVLHLILPMNDGCTWYNVCMHDDDTSNDTCNDYLIIM